MVNGRGGICKIVVYSGRLGSYCGGGGERGEEEEAQRKWGGGRIREGVESRDATAKDEG